MSKQANKRLRRHLRLPVNREPLPAYGWPGGYPMMYHCRDGGTLCPDCVNKEIDLIDCGTFRDKWDTQWHVWAVDANYEDTDCRCDHCGRAIEVAYAE